MFHIGDEVRLNRGHTRMIVIGFTAYGALIAKYDHGTNRDWSRVTLENYENPQAAGSYTRPVSGFTAWDGAPAERMHPMPTNRYRSIVGDPTLYGDLRGRTSKGHFILEMDDGSMVTCPPDEVELDIPFTFSVKATGNSSYRCHYTVPFGAHIKIGDLLHSNGGHTYVVTAVDTKCANPKKEFKGVRLLTEAL